MKHLLPFFVLTLMISTQAVGQDTYEILRIYNAESITIGNRQKKVGDTFKSTDQIVFSNDRQSFKAQKKGTSKAYYFNKKAMEAKKSKTLKAYFHNDYRKSKGSSRNLSGNIPKIIRVECDTLSYYEKRIALVIGNCNYRDADMLPNALNDARDVSDTLKQLGFDVMTLYDGDIQDMHTTIDTFFCQAKDYNAALIYFAGHGIRYEGKDYLLSIDREGLGIKDECSLEYLIDESEKWKSNDKVMIFVIDACRTNMGFPNDRNLHAIEAPNGTIIMQSTSLGKYSIDADSVSGNSPFATAFINGIGQSNEDIENEFSAIRQTVIKSTNAQQVPRISFGSGYNFHFRLTAYHIKGLESFKKKNYSEATNWFLKPANQGHAEDQYLLAQCHEKNGHQTEAFKWYLEAAKRGHVDAQYNVGLRYAHGEGITQSDTDAIKWFSKAADKGHIQAIYNLALFYKKQQSYTMALNLFLELVDSCNKEISDLKSIPKNKGRISEYELGIGPKGECYPYSQLYIGQIYDATQSYPEAAQWYDMLIDSRYQHHFPISSSDKPNPIPFPFTCTIDTTREYCNALFRLKQLSEKGFGDTISNIEFTELLFKFAYNNTAIQDSMGICVDREKPLHKNDPITDSYIRVFRALDKAAEEGNEKAKYYYELCCKSNNIISKIFDVHNKYFRNGWGD